MDDAVIDHLQGCTHASGKDPDSGHLSAAARNGDLDQPALELGREAPGSSETAPGDSPDDKEHRSGRDPESGTWNFKSAWRWRLLAVRHAELRSGVVCAVFLGGLVQRLNQLRLVSSNPHGSRHWLAAAVLRTS